MKVTLATIFEFDVPEGTNPDDLALAIAGDIVSVINIKTMEIVSDVCKGYFTTRVFVNLE